MRPRISITGFVRPSARPSVRGLVGPSVTLSTKTRKIIIFEQINAQAGIVGGSLDTSLHLYRVISPNCGILKRCVSEND